MIARDRGVGGLYLLVLFSTVNAFKKKQSQDLKLNPKQPGRAHTHTHKHTHILDTLFLLLVCCYYWYY